MGKRLEDDNSTTNSQGISSNRQNDDSIQYIFSKLWEAL